MNTSMYSYRNLESLMVTAKKNGPQRRAMKANHFIVLDGEGNGGGDLFLPCTDLVCKCKMLRLVTVDRRFHTIPAGCLKLDPMTIEDLQKASEHVRPSATKEEVENIEYFYKHRRLPPPTPSASNGPSSDYGQRQQQQQLYSRNQEFGIAEWLIFGVAVCIIVFVVISVMKLQGNI